MAHIQKYKQGQCYHLINHDNRSDTDDKENIDHSRSYLNYNLCSVKNENEYLSELIKLSKDSGGRFTNKTNILVSYVITLPENFPDNAELEKQFFKACYNLICSDVGEENIISAWVHYDENLKNSNRPNKPHIHIKVAPLKEKTKTYKNGTTKTILQFDAKNTITLNYLQTFHKRLESHIEDYIGFKAEVLNGATKYGNKTIAELKEISAKKEELEKIKNSCSDKDIELFNYKKNENERKNIINELWKEYQDISNEYWSNYKICKQNIKNDIFEIKRNIKSAEYQLAKDLDFFNNINRGLFFALFKLISGIMIYFINKDLNNEIRRLESNLEELDEVRRSVSGFQNSSKNALKSEDLERIENSIEKWENSVMMSEELINKYLSSKSSIGKLLLNKNKEKEIER